MAQINSVEFKAALQKDEKTATILNKSFQSLLKTEKTLHETDSLFGNNFNAISENESTPNLRKLFHEASNSLKTINLSHQKYV